MPTAKASILPYCHTYVHKAMLRLQRESSLKASQIIDDNAKVYHVNVQLPYRCKETGLPDFAYQNCQLWKILENPGVQNFGMFTAIWYTLPFGRYTLGHSGVFRGHFGVFPGHFVVLRGHFGVFRGHFGIFFPVLVCCTMKNLATLQEDPFYT
jgi:hypothetical protein